MNGAPLPPDELERRLKKKRFVSTRDTISDALMAALWSDDMTEKVNSCLAFLALGLNQLAITEESKEAEKEYLTKLVTWQKAYKYPRARMTMAEDADNNTVMVIEDESSSKSTWTVPFQDAIRYHKLALDSMLLQSYQTELLPIVAEMVAKLTHYKILREEAQEFKPNIDFLLGEEDEDGDEYQD